MGTAHNHLVFADEWRAKGMKEVKRLRMREIEKPVEQSVPWREAEGFSYVALRQKQQVNGPTLPPLPYLSLSDLELFVKSRFFLSYHCVEIEFKPKSWLSSSFWYRDW